MAALLARSFEQRGKPIPLQTVSAWTGLNDLIGSKVPPERIIAELQRYNRNETLFKLARVAAVLANSTEGIFGDDARSWTHNLLSSRQDSANELERYISRAASNLGPKTAIAHAQVLFALQLLAITRGSPGGDLPTDGILA